MSRFSFNFLVCSFAFIALPTYAQVAYTALTSEPCSNLKEPIARMEFKANAANQIVIYTFGKIDSRERGSMVESGCAVVDRDNWSCAGSYATNGKSFKRDKDGDDLHWCHFEKKIFGGWQLISNESSLKSKYPKNSELINRSNSFLAANLKADIFKVSDCRAILQSVNPAFYKKSHLNDAINNLKTLFSYDRNVANLLTDNGINNFKKSVGVQISQSILDELGKSPTPSKCGQVTAGIDAKIEESRARLTD